MLKETMILNPLTHDSTHESVFTNSPLSRVIAQIRFPTQEEINNQDFIRPFGEILQASYPIVRPFQNKGVVIGPQGPIETRIDTTWRFSDVEDTWTVTLAREFIALETSAYTNREDFLDRLEKVLGIFQRHIGAASVDRIGIRYVYRFAGEDLDKLSELVRPELTGLLKSPFGDAVRHSMVDHEFELPDQNGRLRTRWGLVPAGTTIDPSAIPPMGAPSWILDLDGYALESRALDVESVVDESRDFCERVHTFLQWSITENFLARFG